jgi:hypothetical protein
MAIVKHNVGTDFSGVSVIEASYIVNSYIEESFNDLQIKCLMVDNRSLQESGVRYFTEENEAGNKKLSEKIKGIFKAVWDGIVGIFNKIKEFFGNLITNFKVKASDPKNKDAVKNASYDTVKEIVKDKVSVYYNLTKYEDALRDLVDIVGNGDDFDGTYGLVPDEIKTSEVTGDKLPSVITKDVLLKSAFGGFRDEFRDVQTKFKNVEKAFKKIEDKSDAATNSVHYDDNNQVMLFRSVKASLKALNAYSAGYSKMIIHNAKMLVKVVNAIVKDSNKKKDKTQATGESASWDFVF